ncbi:MAG: hypothetical protein AABY64_09665 [Bdellovibrionota bacterium]|mgnify:CR=1 FL=1
MKFNSMFVLVMCVFLLKSIFVKAEDFNATDKLPKQKEPAPASASSSSSSSWDFSAITNLSLGRSAAEQEKISKAATASTENNIKIDAACDTLKGLDTGTFFNQNGKLSLLVSTLYGHCKKFRLARAACWGTHGVAANACLAERSVSMTSILAGAQAFAALGSQMTIQNTCSGAAKALRTMQVGMAAYTAVCTAAQVGCATSCGSAESNLKQFSAYTGTSMGKALAPCTLDDVIANELPAVTKDGGIPTLANAPQCFAGKDMLEGVLNNLSEQLKMELNPELLPVTAGMSKTCSIDFQSMAAAGLATAASLVQAHMQSVACEKQTAANAAAAAMNCDDPANSSVPDCICKKSPRSQGCQNALIKAGGPETATASGSTAPTLLGTRSGLPPEGTTVGRDPAGVAEKSTAASNAGGAQAGAPVGGSGGGVGGTDGTGAGGGQEMPGGHRGRGYNTNVMGGYDGGGGSGGGRGGFRSDADANKALANYRKGIDPVKVAAQAWSREVSPQSGRSNFEKIKSRYNDNRRTLVGQ